MTVRIFLCLPLVLIQILVCKGQSSRPWNGKECAVVLTYDDAIDIDLDNVVPALDSVGLEAITEPPANLRNRPGCDGPLHGRKGTGASQ